MNKAVSESPDREQTLKNSLEELNQRYFEMDDLLILSNQLLKTFTNPIDKEGGGVPEPRQPETLIGEFDFVSVRMKRNIIGIKSNLERVIEMIG